MPMRLPILPRTVLPLFLVLIATAAAPAAAATPPCDFWDGDELHLVGHIGGVDVVVYLHPGWPSRHKPDGTSGLAMYTAQWRAGRGDEGLVALDGPLPDGCRLGLETLTGQGTWSLRFVSTTRLEGTRRVDGRSDAIALDVTAPFDCSAGPWKTFEEPRWPVTFEYPASARFTAGVNLACPDLSRLAWGARPLSIARVQIETSKLADGRTRTTVGPFFRDGAGPWQIDERRFELGVDDDACSQERPSGTRDRDDDTPIRECQAATRSRWRGFTVLEGESSGEYRGSRPGGGGYTGQGSGPSYYAFLVGKEAVVVSSDDLPDRIADVDRAPSRNERSTSRMAARVIRSLKRR
jgi:hypothetical protein